MHWTGEYSKIDEEEEGLTEDDSAEDRSDEKILGKRQMKIIREYLEFMVDLVEENSSLRAKNKALQVKLQTALPAAQQPTPPISPRSSFDAAPTKHSQDSWANVATSNSVPTRLQKTSSQQKHLPMKTGLLSTWVKCAVARVRQFILRKIRALLC